MIAPHSLALLGNLAGAWGRLLTFGLAGAAGTYLVVIHLSGRFFSRGAVEGRLPAGGTFAAILPLAARLLTALAGATGLVVTAGFTFNETFLHWFPNFAFAFLLLGVIVLIQSGGNRLIQTAQLGFVAVALSGLLLITLIALTRTGGVSPSVDGAGGGFAWAAILLLFVGVDLVWLNPSATEAEIPHVMTIGVLGAALIFALWGWAAVRQVPLERLVDSTIAPVLVAKRAWGQWGRLIMGTVTIAGTLAAVNALFVVVAASVGTLVGAAERGGHRFSQRGSSLILGVAVAAALALGLAGTEGIDVALRAGLVLWLLSYVQASLLSSSEKRRVGRPLAVLGGGVMLAGAAHILFTDPDRGLMLTFMLAGLAAAALMAAGSWGWAVVKKRS